MKALDRPASEYYYAVAGRLLFVTVSDPRLSQTVSQLFTRWSLDLKVANGTEPDARIRILFESCPLSVIPSDWPSFETAGNGRCYTNGDSFYLVFSNSVILVEPAETRSATVWIAALDHSADIEIAHSISFVVCAVLRRCNLFEIHAAGVVEPDSDRTTLIVGPSGSGKSTLSFNLIKAGWNYLSDDHLLLEEVDGEIQARGFRRFFAVDSSLSVAGVPASLGNSIEPEREANRKTCFEPSTIYPVRELTFSKPGRLLFVELNVANTSSLTELSPIESVSRLFRACPWATYDRAVAKNYLSVLSQLGRQSTAFELRAGTDLLSPHAASEMLGRLA